MRPPTMGRSSSTSARSRLASQCGAAVQSESIKATISPRAASIPWFLELSAPVCAFSTIRTDGNRARTQGTTVDIADMPEASVTDGVRVTEAVLMLGRTEEAMAELPEGQREVMLLVCVEELSYREAAEVIGVPIGTVMSRLARARLAHAERLGIK